MRKFIAFSMTVALILGCLCSCGKDSRTALQVLEDIFENEKELPSGQLYLTGAEAGASEYFSDRMVSVMYGEKAKDQYFYLIGDGAVFLSSFANAFEIAVFRCYSKSDVDSICEMCFSRCDTVRSVINHQKGFENVKARVFFSGKYVCMYVGEDPDGAERAFVNALK